MNRDERDEQIWLYAAGALSDAEMQTVRALLEQGDAEDLSSLATARETLARLPDVLPPVAPSDAVLKRLLKRTGVDVPASESTTLRRSRMWIGPALIAAAAACVAVMTFLDAKNTRKQNEQMKSQLDQALAALESARSQAATELTQLKTQMQAQQVASAKQMDELIAQTRLLFQPNLQFTALEGQNLPRGGGRVIWDQSNRKSHVFVFDLAPLPPGKVYELWFIEDPSKAPVPAGTFTVDAQGNGQIVSPIPEGMNNIQLAAITEEPAGGSATPTMPIKLIGKVQAQ